MSIAPPPTPVPRKSRRPLLLVGVFVLLLAMAPVAFYFVGAWLSQRELDALYAEWRPEMRGLASAPDKK
jgi:hypothetical protein